MLTISDLPQASDFCGRQRDSIWERELARRLRQLSEQDRWSFISELLDYHQVVALDLARRCLSRPKYFEQILIRGLREADASMIRWWLECTVIPLGLRRVARILTKEAETNPEGVAKAKYWLPIFSNHPNYQHVLFVD